MCDIRITIEDFRPRPAVTHVMEFALPPGRVKQYDITVDGRAWKRMGMARALAGIRKALRPTRQEQQT